MSPKSFRPSAVGDVLRDVLKRVDPDQQLRAYRIWTFWDDEVGDALARRAQPLHFRDGVLVVAVATHSWLQELRFMKDTLRERLNARLDANLIHDIFFVSGSVERQSARPQATAAEAAPVGPSLIPLPPISNPDLANAFTRVLQARAKRLARGQRAPARRSRVHKPD